VSISVSINGYYGIFALKIYNTAGEHILTLAEKDLAGPEVNTYSWDGKNKGGHQCASGVYVIYMIGAYERKIARVVLINE